MQVQSGDFWHQSNDWDLLLDGLQRLPIWWPHLQLPGHHRWCSVLCSWLLIIGDFDSWWFWFMVDQVGSYFYDKNSVTCSSTFQVLIIFTIIFTRISPFSSLTSSSTSPPTSSSPCSRWSLFSPEPKEEAKQSEHWASVTAHRWVQGFVAVKKNCQVWWWLFWLWWIWWQLLWWQWF